MPFGLRSLNQNNVFQIDENYQNLGFLSGVAPNFPRPSGGARPGPSEMYVAGGTLRAGAGDLMGGSYGARVWRADGSLAYDSRWRQFYVADVVRGNDPRWGAGVPTPDGTNNWVLSYPLCCVGYDLQSMSGTPEGPFDAHYQYYVPYISGGRIHLDVQWEGGFYPVSVDIEVTYGDNGGFGAQHTGAPVGWRQVDGVGQNFNVFVGRLA